MDPRTLEFIATACAGELLNGSPQTMVSRISTDSRQIQPGDLFFALVGERFDGHAFLAEAASKGAAAAVVARRRALPYMGHCAVLAVDDPRQALGRLAARYRQDFAAKMIVVTGSNGKTTTKELVAAVLRQKVPTLWSQASFNNDVGVPLSLLGLTGAHQAAVVEAGTNHAGELAPLVQMIDPAWGVLTSIGREHLEFFGDLDGVAREEGVLADLLPRSGKLFTDGDSEWTARVGQRSRAALVRVGFLEGNDWQAQAVKVDREGTSFRVKAPEAEFGGEFRVNLLGRHQVVNALLAIAVGHEFGLGRAEVERGLLACKGAKMRLELWEVRGALVLDDAYNANADSMHAALQTLRDLPCKGRRLAVLGDMAELGSHSESAHEEVGRRAGEIGVDQLFAVGKMASLIGRGARQAGLNRVLEFTDVGAAGAAVKRFLKSGDVLLLKASRATRLEQIAEALRTCDPERRE
jgi:UDP-N-acetylmuramoyl-tripeptide--D-alanyl-D-alanine ligase